MRRILSPIPLIGRAADLVWLAALVWYVLAGIEEVPFHGDESMLIYMSRDYYYLVQQRDLDPVLYTATPVNPSEQELRLLNGTVGKMAMGFAWDMAGFTVDDLNEPWAWGLNWDINAAMQHIPREDVLHAARLSSAILTAISVAAVFGIAWLVMRPASLAGARIAAWSASLVYVTTPAVLVNGRRAMMDGALLCFLTLTVLVGLLLIREQARTHPRRAALGTWTVLLGLLGGCAVASKHNAALGVGTVFLAVALEPVITSPPGPLSSQGRFAKGEGEKVGTGSVLRLGAKHFTIPHLARLIVVSVLVILTFLAWNPAWWSDLGGMPERVLRMRADLLRGQVNNYGGYSGVADRIPGLFNAMFAAQPQYYEVSEWRDYVASEIAAYDGSWLAGRGGGLIWGALLAGLFAVGLVALVRRWRDAVSWLALVWLAVTALGLLISTPLEWQRYYLPLQPAVALVCGVGVWWLTAWVWARVRNA
jgi:hypothetical protein